MFNLGTGESMAILQLTIILLTIIHQTNAFDQCDVRGRMTVSKECKNKHSDSKCEQYARLGYCTGQTYENMFIQCKRSCGFCIAPDLYEEIPKTTCLPERNRKYDMKVKAKMDCGIDPTCSGVVESPKRRNQNKKFGKHYILTEREWILCNYPVSTKPTNDTLFLRKRGPSAACAHENIKDLSSFDSMKEGGWDLGNIDEKERLVLPRETCDAALDRIDKHNWLVQKWIPSMISNTFWGSGRVVLKFDNCNNQGEVSIIVDGTEVAKSKTIGGETTATFNVEEGSVLEIKADNRAIIRLKDLQIECGVSATTLETRPAFDGYKYNADEYCSEPTYNNDASKIEEAVTKCTNDPDCSAIEDRWGTGKPPIGLCKRKKGKRAGGGTYLLKKDVPAQDGGWTDWTAWSSCSRTCKPPPGDLALKTRQRTCSNPPPALGGEDCKGLADDVELCNQDIPCESCDDGILNQDEERIDCGGACPACPAYYPSGPQTNVALSTIINGGWELCYSATYGTNMPSSVTSRIRNSQCTKSKLMLGCRSKSHPNTILTLAWASRDCVFYDTGRSSSRLKSCEGTDWYFSNSYSWGFAKQGDGVSRGSCDTRTNGCNECRLCWHTPSNGYRCGSNRGLNGASSHEKVIFQMD